MTKNKVLTAINEVDNRFIDEAIGYKPKKNGVFKRMMSLAAAAACLVIAIGVASLVNANKVDSVVSIDVNPSIELTVDKHDKVLTAVALNPDAEKVLEGMKLKNVDLNTALNAIVGSLLQNGYLDDVSNAVNICVENEDAKRADELGKKVSGEISTILVTNDLIGTVNSQTCTYDKETQKQAESYGISVGKYLLAKDVTAKTGVTLDQTVNLSVSELWALYKVNDVAQLITKDAALKIATDDAKVAVESITEVNTKLHENHGEFRYDIKFRVDELKEYKYKVDAVSGTILEYEFKIHEEKPEKPEKPAPEGQITKTEALAIAYADAGVAQQEAVLNELKHKPKEKEYSIEFSAGNYDYFYLINAVNKSIVNKEITEKVKDETTSETPLVAKISLETALQTALTAANVKFEDLSMCDVKFHTKKDKIEYKVHFHVDKTHYEYNVDAVTGVCVEKKRPEPKDKPEPLKEEKVEKPKPEKPKPEEPKDKKEKPEVEKPKSEKPKVEKPKVPELEKPEAPKIEISEMPTIEEPKPLQAETRLAPAEKKSPKAEKPEPHKKKAEPEIKEKPVAPHEVVAEP